MRDTNIMSLKIHDLLLLRRIVLLHVNAGYDSTFSCTLHTVSLSYHYSRQPPASRRQLLAPPSSPASSTTLPLPHNSHAHPASPSCPPRHSSTTPTAGSPSRLPTQSLLPQLPGHHITRNPLSHFPVTYHHTSPQRPPFASTLRAFAPHIPKDTASHPLLTHQTPYILSPNQPESHPSPPSRPTLPSSTPEPPFPYP